MHISTDRKSLQTSAPPATPLNLWSEYIQTALQIPWLIQSAAIMAMLASTTKAVRSRVRHGFLMLSRVHKSATISANIAGIKDIDAIPNQSGYSLKDYKAVFGEKYVHGCVPWEDEHIRKEDRKKFEKLHSRRVQILQELHGIEQGIRELMQ